jgi:hypothetical protein
LEFCAGIFVALDKRTMAAPVEQDFGLSGSTAKPTTTNTATPGFPEITSFSESSVPPSCGILSNSVRGLRRALWVLPLAESQRRIQDITVNMQAARLRDTILPDI